MITPATAAEILRALTEGFVPEPDNDPAAARTLIRQARWLADTTAAGLDVWSLRGRMEDQQIIAERGILRERPLARSRAEALARELATAERRLAGLLDERPDVPAQPALRMGGPGWNTSGATAPGRADSC